MALVLEAQAVRKSGDPETSISRLRTIRSSHEPAALLLATIYVGLGRVDDATTTLSAAATQFHNPRHLVSGATLLLDKAKSNEGDEEALASAKDLANQAIMLAGEDFTVRQAARAVLFTVAQRRRNWREVESITRALIADDGETEELRWQLVGSLFNQHQIPEASTVLRSPSLLHPRDQQEARVWMLVMQRGQRTAEVAGIMLDLVEAYPDAELVTSLVTSSGITAVMMFGDALDSPGSELATRLLIARTAFLERFPSNESLDEVHFGETADETTEALRPLLEPGAAAFADLQRKAAVAEVPFGMLALQAHHPYASAFLQRAAGCLPTRLPLSAIDAMELDVARAAVGQ